MDIRPASTGKVNLVVVLYDLDEVEITKAMRIGSGQSPIAAAAKFANKNKTRCAYSVSAVNHDGSHADWELDGKCK